MKLRKYISAAVICIILGILSAACDATDTGQAPLKKFPVSEQSQKNDTDTEKREDYDPGLSPVSVQESAAGTPVTAVEISGKNIYEKNTVAYADKKSFFTAIKDTGEEKRLILGIEEAGKYSEIFSVVEPTVGGSCFQIEYVQGSREKSGGGKLYFTLLNRSSGQRSLYCYWFDTGIFPCVLPEGCSNMILFDDEESDEGYGWVIYEHMILPISLEDASVYEPKLDSLDYIKEFEELNGTFFSDEEGKVKYTLIESAAEETLHITVKSSISLGANRPEFEWQGTL